MSNNSRTKPARKVITKHSKISQKIIDRQSRTKQKTWSKLVLGVLVTLPILLFFYQYLSTPHKIIAGDFDYYTQLYEAFRISILKYHQLPLWNPWMSGGVPLFANPQFGLFSIQALLTLSFGAIYGLKLTYVLYAVVGLWGMIFLTRRVFKASALRSLLVAYIWIFSGFFAGHNISHITTVSFFLLPWLLYFLIERRNKYSWLWFGLLFCVVLLSAIDFVLLMLFLFIAAFLILSRSEFSSQYRFRFRWSITKTDGLFLLKAGAIIAILSSYRFILTDMFVADNPRPAALLLETRPTITIIFQALFLPVGSFLKIPRTQWVWGEYSMYMGLGVSVAFFLCLILLMISLFKKTILDRKQFTVFVWPMLGVGIIGFLLALGNFGILSPYHLLKLLPGYSQTRVSSRWLFLTAFSMLILLASWKRNKKIITILLFLSVIELFFTNGPPRNTGSKEVAIPSSQFSNTFIEYDNGKKHDPENNIMHSYYYTTSRNVGQIYSDESLDDTLDRVIGTSKCGLNFNPNCAFVLSHNAKVAYWSPNKIIIDRTSQGSIVLNMNESNGWRINNAYPFATEKRTDPSIQFVLPPNQATYTLVYAPKFSPPWLSWRIHKLLGK
jgi:hypothetical protein